MCYKTTAFLLLVSLFFCKANAQVMSILDSDKIYHCDNIIDNDVTTYANSTSQTSYGMVQISMDGVNYLKDINIHVYGGSGFTATVSYFDRYENNQITLGQLALGLNDFTIDDYVGSILIECSFSGGGNIYISELELVNPEFRSVAYAYDAAGNRTRRYLSITSTKSGYIDQDQKEVENEINWDALGLAIYPNPTDGLLELSFKDFNNEKKIKANLYDINGRLIIQKSINTDNTYFDLHEYSNGTYILKVQIDNEFKTYQIIKK